ncbi:AsmA family protein [Vibrio metschnikovii]
MAQPRLRKQGQWQIDSLLIDGANLSSGLPSYQWPKQWALHQLAIRNIDYVHHDWIIRGLSGQIEQPQWPATTHSLPYGKLQLSAEQVYWQGEALSQLLIDADHRAQQSTIYGFSFACSDRRFFWPSGTVSTRLVISECHHQSLKYHPKLTITSAGLARAY